MIYNPRHRRESDGRLCAWCDLSITTRTKRLSGFHTTIIIPVYSTRRIDDRAWWSFAGKYHAEIWSRRCSKCAEGESIMHNCDNCNAHKACFVSSCVDRREDFFRYESAIMWISLWERTSVLSWQKRVRVVCLRKNGSWIKTVRARIPIDSFLINQTVKFCSSSARREAYFVGIS